MDKKFTVFSKKMNSYIPISEALNAPKIVIQPDMAGNIFLSWVDGGWTNSKDGGSWLDNGWNNSKDGNSWMDKGWANSKDGSSWADNGWTNSKDGGSWMDNGWTNTK